MRYIAVILLVLFSACHGEPQHRAAVEVVYAFGDKDTIYVNISDSSCLALDEGEFQWRNTAKFEGSEIWHTLASGVRRYKIIHQ